MNNLIDKQTAIDVLEERLKANGYSNVALVSELNRSIGYLMRLPTVDAIPVEWLEKWFTEKYRRSVVWWDCAEDVFKAFMEDWEKENETERR